MAPIDRATSGAEEDACERRIIALPQLLSPSKASLLWADEKGGVLYIPPTELARQRGYAKHPYLPVREIPQGVSRPDVIVEISQKGESVTTLHFCAIWHKEQQENQRWHWERVSFSSLGDAGQYDAPACDIPGPNPVCQSCFRIHPRRSCPLTEPMSLDEALSLSGTALRVHHGDVYLVSWSPHVPLFGDLWHGRVSWHALRRLNGIQACPEPHLFVEMEAGKRFLSTRQVPFAEGWIAVDERPSIFLW